jgi:superfamily II DNA or RNA helicase
LREDRPVIVTVDSLIRVPSGALHPKSRELLARGLTFPNPEYVNRVRFDRWVGSTPEEISLLEGDGAGALTMPRGAIGILRQALSATGHRAVFRDDRVLLSPRQKEMAFELRDYQEQAVDAMVRHVQGCAVLPCGAGKTVVGAGVIARTGQPSLVLVHTHDLLSQWVETIRDALGLEAGIIAEGRMAVEEVTVATVQTLGALLPDELAYLGRRFGTVILDEAHHAPAAVFRSVLSAFAGKHRYGLTATPDRADGLGPLLELCIGPVLFEVSHEQLVQGGYLIIPRIVPVETGIACESASHTKMVSALIKHQSRNRLIVELVAGEAERGRSVLILSARVEHCRHLAGLLNEAGVSAEALTGKTSKAKRAEMLSRFREGTLPVVCATSLADEGLDVSRLERLVLATPAQAEGRTIQRLGRLMRPHPGKDTPVLYDLVDKALMARRQFGERKRAYIKVVGRGCLEEPVFPTGQALLFSPSCRALPRASHG